MSQDIRKPVESLLSFEIEEVDFKKLKRYAKGIDEIIAMGTHLLLWEIKSRNTSDQESAVIISLFRRALQALDGASLLIENGAVTPAKTLYRVVLEISIQFQYFLLDPNKIQAKTLHFSIMEDYQRLLEVELLRGKNSLAQHRQYFDEEIKELNESIAHARYDPIRNDFHKCVNKSDGQRKERPKSWYYMSGGGGSFTELFSKLDGKQKHREVYAFLSDVVHSAKTIRDSIYQDQSGKNRIRRIRDFTQLHDVATTLITITLELYSCMLKRRRYLEKQQYLFSLEEWRREYSELYFKASF